ncbi:MAG: electron transport complex subunit RsxE [Candidatus Muiribacterium halophilum]|uniref:Ion-translocating oxidoreductase complex subunit E n=1 Tax=Muiribacterium halophilum TaxID=2053465 RepID=A0A2N5ZHU6_MUIH1|nr:MAG: electron transport complex subunit RsxE [Candidatus Muirbacterium halophilum]
MNIIEAFKNGLFKENPVFVLMLGLCPTLGVTSSLENGLGIGLATTFVLIGSNLVISLLKSVIPKKIRIPIFIVVIASFVTLVDMLMNAYFQVLYEKLGIFIPLIVVNCVILGRAEAFASKNGLFPSFIDAISMGAGFTLALSLIGSIREITGNGTILNIYLFGSGFEPALIMILPPGAFFTIGLLVGAKKYFEERR